MRRHILEYLASIIITLSFAVLYGILEYYWIITDRDVPFRYGHGPVFLGFELYHVAIMFPILLIVGFSPFIDDLLGTSKVIEKGYTAALGAASTVFSVMLEDIVWFLCRTVRPLPLDQLGGKWIQASDWTARWSYLTIPGGVIPTWYVMIVIATVPVWTAVLRHWSMETVSGLRAKLTRLGYEASH